MKRDNEHLHPSYPPHINTSFTGKMCWEEENTCNKGDQFLHPDAGMDELLAVLGYKVKSSDMAQVAQKLEQLEEAMCSVPEEGLSQLATESVHYNPSDISNWIGNMLSEFTPPNSSTGFIDQIVYPPHQIYTANKRLKPTLLNSVEEASTSTSARQIVVFDSQEDGVRLVHTLMACAEAIHQSNLQIAETLVNQIGLLAASQAGAMRKVAIYFAEALARRIYNFNPSDSINPTFTDILQIHFYEISPYLKFAHFTANQAILEAFSGKDKVHVVDFAINRGMQWPPLMQALALRPGGPPTFRLTGIGPPSPDGSDRLHEVGIRLGQLAETIGVEFEFRGFVANSVADLDASILDLKPSETESIAINSVFELHRILARPGAVEKVLSLVKEIKPAIVTVAEQEANHNGSIFIDRFTESLHYYSTLFDSLEGLADTQDKVMSEVYLGHQICNVVACEGLDRIERHEPLDQWRERFGSAGFESVHIGSNAYKQASMLLDLFSSVEGYKVEENAGCLLLGWHTRTLIATSAWRVGSGQ